jgi:hypothetical protein
VDDTDGRSVVAGDVRREKHMKAACESLRGLQAAAVGTEFGSCVERVHGRVGRELS